MNMARAVLAPLVFVEKEVDRTDLSSDFYDCILEFNLGKFVEFRKDSSVFIGSSAIELPLLGNGTFTADSKRCEVQICFSFPYSASTMDGSVSPSVSR